MSISISISIIITVPASASSIMLTNRAPSHASLPASLPINNRPSSPRDASSTQRVDEWLSKLRRWDQDWSLTFDLMSLVTGPTRNGLMGWRKTFATGTKLPEIRNAGRIVVLKLPHRHDLLSAKALHIRGGSVTTQERALVSSLGKGLPS